MLDNGENINPDLEAYASNYVTETFQAKVVHNHHDNELRHSNLVYDYNNKLDYIKKQLIYFNLSKNKADLEKLVNYFKHRLKQKPFDLDLTKSLGTCLEKLGQVNRVKRLYSRFIKQKQPADIIAFRLANIFFGEGSYKKALTYYRQALSKSTQLNNATIYIKLAYCCQNTKEFQLGSEFAGLALKESTSHSTPEILLLFGNLFLGSKQYEKAIEFYQQGLESLNKYSTQIKNLVHSSTSQNEISLATFDKAVKLTFPKILEPKMLSNLGEAFNKLGKYSSAQAVLEKAISLAHLPNTYNNLALTAKALGNLDGALIHLSKARQILPNSVLINQNLAETHLAMGHDSKAIEYFNKALVLDHKNQSVKFKLYALLGKKMDSAPERYVSDLFDKYSETYDRHLLSSLNYEVPKEISEYINLRYGTTRKLGTVLDLGCGTGLCGLGLIDRCTELIGIDLSKQMLIKAKEKNIYTHLKNVELTKYLKNSKSKFDVMIAADVLIYLGKLDKLFRYSRRAIRDGGRFIFTVEVTNTNRFQVNKTGRFSHSRKYIEELAEKELWYIEFEKQINIRKENSSQVRGLLFSLLKK
ncbi:MAG: hypothetical protein CML39_01645 [Rhodobacteraceae bacterium]|nr:MAG: hypothetical protein CML39_01645 [Paracoccaceae bacterium]